MTAPKVELPDVVDRTYETRYDLGLACALWALEEAAKEVRKMSEPQASEDYAAAIRGKAAALKEGK